jgi:hypothetical protein
MWGMMQLCPNDAPIWELVQWGVSSPRQLSCAFVVGRDGIEPPNLPVFSRTLYQLSYLPRSDRGGRPGPSRGPDGI